MQASMLDLGEVAVSIAGEGQTHLCLYRMIRVGQRGTHDLKSLVEVKIRCPYDLT